MIETIQAGVMVGTAIGAIFAGIAAVMRARYWGKAHLLRAERGDPEFPSEPSLLKLLLIQQRTTRP